MNIPAGKVSVDDPVYTLEGPDLETAAADLAVVLLWTAVAGFPVKLSKATGGKRVEWVGASISCRDEEKAVVVTIPKAKVAQLLAETEKHLGRAVIGAKELRSYAGALSFVAGLVPHLRPFLATFWAALSKHDITSDGSPYTRTRKLIHVRRVSPALRWVKALLSGTETVERIFYANPPATDLELVTDASPWGIGGVCRRNGEPLAYFHSHLPDDILAKFSAERGVSSYNTLWEGLALLVAFRLWLPALTHGSVFRAKSDNLGFLMALSKGSAKSPALNVLAREFAFDQATRCYQIRGLVHIAGVSNVQADALSRLSAPERKPFPSELLATPRCEAKLGGDSWKVVLLSGGLWKMSGSRTGQGQELLLADSRSVTSVGPVESRLKLWCDVSKRARLEPFRLTPDGIYSVMGAFKAAGYRSAMQYLDLAKQEHIHRGHAWSEQLALAYRVCSRSCKRALGPSKQASALPMDKVPTVTRDEAMVTNGPRDPGTATIVASWWLLREIEASHARIQHLTFDHESKTVAWLLPSSKTDVAALGATRKHACSCEVLSPQLCPYHSVLRLVGSRGPLEPVFVDINGAPPSKAGWADTARALGVPVSWPMIRQMSQLSELAIEAGHKDSLARARRELEALLRKARPSLAIPDADWCDELIGTEAPPPPSVPHDSSERLILNLSPGGKIHRCRTDFSEVQEMFSLGASDKLVCEFRVGVFSQVGVIPALLSFRIISDPISKKSDLTGLRQSPAFRCVGDWRKELTIADEGGHEAAVAQLERCVETYQWQWRVCFRSLASMLIFLHVLYLIAPDVHADPKDSPLLALLLTPFVSNPLALAPANSPVRLLPAEGALCCLLAMLLGSRAPLPLALGVSVAHVGLWFWAALAAAESLALLLPISLLAPFLWVLAWYVGQSMKIGEVGLRDLRGLAEPDKAKGS
ncbi:unnamed protein product [Symbiodinium natans]|uniref:Uncharacterized protein n=1 Tax=Symbiodinium natans TaxID=878477 RepID=A0A812QK42_9DINO|nr:unnamed protein product [Symbiodinium natans]